MSNQNRLDRLDTLHHAALRVKDVKEAVEWYTQRFQCAVEYQDGTWAMLLFENVRLAFVVAGQHPPHIAIVGDPASFGEPKVHRDGTSSVYLKDPNGNNVEVMSATAEAAPAKS
jgi:catechol 2,3-dioxygenase-like lactoylglutathione lyase family enzyme